MDPVRPTIRCLHEDLKLPLPPITVPLDGINHPLIAKAHEQFGESGTPHERIAAIDDTVLLKVKVQRWRGAVWVDAGLPWLVAAGRREAGSPDDFYTALSTAGRARRIRYNTTHKRALKTDTSVAHLLPDDDDRLRLKLEASTRFVRHLEALLPDLVRRSLHDGHEHSADLNAFVLGVQVRADHGHETYVAIRITGSVSANVTQVILDIMPGCEPDGWYPEASLPDRLLGPNEQAWSNIMDTDAAAKLLEAE